MFIWWLEGVGGRVGSLVKFGASRVIFIEGSGGRVVIGGQVWRELEFLVFEGGAC